MGLVEPPTYAEWRSFSQRKADDWLMFEQEARRQSPDSEIDLSELQQGLEGQGRREW